MKRQRMSALEQAEERAGYLFILPNFLGICIFIVLPVVFTLFIGLTKWNPIQGVQGITLVGFDNFIRIFSDERVISSLKNNLAYTFTYVPITLCLALALAGILNNLAHCKVPLRMLSFMPYITSMVSVSTVWMLLLYPEIGPVNTFLKNVLHLPYTPGWFVESRWALSALIIMGIWHDAGYYMIILVSGMQGISREMYEAADIDGSSPLRSFFQITIPMLVPTIFFCIVVSTIGSFKLFDTVNVITKGGPGYATSTLVYTMYLNGFQFFEFGYASSIAVLLFVIVFILSMVQIKIRNRLDWGGRP